LSSSRSATLGPPAGPAAEHSAKNAWLFFFAGVVLFTLAMMLASFPAGFYTVFVSHLSNSYTSSTPVYGLAYDFMLSTVQVPVSGNLGDVFVLSSAVYFGFLLLSAAQGGGVLRALRGATSKGYRELFSSPLAGMMVLLGAASLVTILIDSVQSSAGIQTGSVSGDPFDLLVNFTLAPLLEESTFRLVMIGVPVALLSVILLREFSPKQILHVLWRPSSAWDVDETSEFEGVRTFEGSGFSLFPPGSSESLKVRAIKPVVLVFLVLSSVMFGYAHYASGAGWGPGKISEAALAGLALGYLYVKYGFHTSVLMHWSINYVGSVFSFLAQGLYGIPWTSNSGSFLDVFPTFDLVFLLGVPSLLLVVNELLKGLGSRQ